MKRQSLLGIALLFFPLLLISGNQGPAGPLIRSMSVNTSYDFTRKSDPVRSYRPDADMSHLYFIPDYGRVGVTMELAPADGLRILLTGNLSTLKAFETFNLTYMDPLEYEVPFEEFSGMAELEARVSGHITLMAGGALMSGVQPGMEWMEMDLGGEYVAVARPYRDGFGYLGVTGEWQQAEFEVVGSAAKFHGAGAYQATLRGAWIPFGSGNTKLGGMITLLADSLDRSGRILWGIDLEQHLAGKIWLQAGAAFGRMQNWWDLNNRLILNMYDPVTSEIFAGIYLRDLTKNLSLTAGYGFTTRDTAWDLWQYGEYTGTEVLKSNTGRIRAGLIWKF